MGQIMISFIELSKENFDATEEQLIGELASEFGSCDDMLSELKGAMSTLFCELSSYGELGVAVCSGTLIVRTLDSGKYSFVYPIPLTEKADIQGAVEATREYAVFEEIPLIFTDVPKDEISYLVSGYRHITLDAEDENADLYRVSLSSELEFVQKTPSVKVSRISLGELLPEDIPEYARLCRDAHINKYWGYDYRLDAPDATDSFFFDTQREEFLRSVSLTLAVRYNGRLIGEANLHAFDLKGGADCAFRLFSDYHGKGLGRETLLSLISIAKQIGLVRLYGRVMPENTSSIALLSSIMQKHCEGIYYINLQ